MELLLEGGHRVDSNDPEALEKATTMLEQVTLENATTLDLEKAAEKGELTPEKARKILHDGEVHGKPLTDQQRKYFGAVAGGTAKKSESVTISSIDELANYGGTLEKAKRSLQAPKEWWDKTIKAVAATPKYKGYKRERLAKIVGDIWTGLDDKKKKEIRGRYGKEFGAAIEKSDDAPGESLEETSTKELTATLDDIKARLKKKPGDAALLARQKAISAELGKRQPPDFGTKSMASIDALEQFSKAIYIGPRGGRWLDPKHTIPWKAEGAKKPAAAEKPAGKIPASLKGDILVNGKRHTVATTWKPESDNMGGHTRSYRIVTARGKEKNMIEHITADGKSSFGVETARRKYLTSEVKDVADKKKVHKLDAKRKELAEAIAEHHEGDAGQVMYSAEHDRMEWVREENVAESKAAGHKKVKTSGKPSAAKEPAKKEGGGEKPAMSGDRKQEIKNIGEKQRKAYSTAYKQAVASGKAADYRQAAAYASNMVTVMRDLGDKEGASDWQVKYHQSMNAARYAKYEKPAEIKEASKKTEKSLSVWIDEQEADMTNENADLLKALGDDAELAKGMMGYGGKRITEWADQFYQDTGLETQALQCVKDMIACQKRWEAHHKGGNPVEEMSRKRGLVIQKEEDAIRMKMRDLEAKLIDYRIKEAKVRKTMGKSGVEALSDFAKGGDAVVDVDVEVVKNETGTSVLVNYLEKAQTMPTGEPGMSRGPEDGADLARVKGPTGSVDSSAGPPIGAPAAGKKKKLSEDDDEVEAQLKGRKKPIERMTGKSMAVPGHQREMVAHENAQLVSALRKGPDDITIGPGVPAPVVEPEPVHKANRWVQGEDSLVVYGDGSDAAAARLVKGEDFYAGGQAPALGRNPMALNQRKPCRACGATMAKSLSVCPHCGDGAGLRKQGTLRIAASAVRNGPGLRPSRHVADIVIK